jgi:hypothetical protein
MGKDLNWAGERIDQWQAVVVKHALTGAGRRAHLVFATESGARAALAALGIKDLEPLAAADRDIRRSRGSGMKVAIGQATAGDDQFLVRAVEQLRELDPATIRLRPY